MAEDSDQSSKTHLPTQKKQREAARKGDVFLSRELATFLVMASGAIWLAGAGTWLLASFARSLGSGLAFGRDEIFKPDFSVRLWAIMEPLFLPVAMLLAATLVAAVAATAATGSLGFRTASIAWRGSKVNPLAGLKRIFGRQALAELGKAVAKTVLLLAFGWWGLQPVVRSLGVQPSLDIHSAFAVTSSQSVQLLAWMMAALLIVAIIDLPLQYRQRLSRLKMSLQDLRDEYKQDEGSPELKQARRQRQHALASGSLRTAVREATVILTNPTHFAVALRYRPDLDAVPLVTARGRGATAAAIRELAALSKVPVLSYPDLARALYYGVPTGRAVREDFYQPLAIILAWLFDLDRRAGRMTAPPSVEIPDALRVDADGRPAPKR